MVDTTEATMSRGEAGARLPSPTSRCPRTWSTWRTWIAEEHTALRPRAPSSSSPAARGKAKTDFYAEPRAKPGKLTDKQRDLLQRLPGPAGKDLQALRRLEARGLVKISERSERRTPRTNAIEDRVHDLTQPQIDALAAIDAGGSHLLHGVTGSGKTEVYLRAAQACLQRGEGVIVLVPEIALTPQTVARFQARFGDTVALLHSVLSEGERYDEWRRLRTSEARIAVGPRSAVFAPVENLGLIVLDEEHDASYKQDGDPRYDARHVAAYRAYQSGARLVAGGHPAPGNGPHHAPPAAPRTRGDQEAAGLP